MKKTPTRAPRRVELVHTSQPARQKRARRDLAVDDLFSPKERAWISTVEELRMKGDNRPLGDRLGPNVRTYKKQVRDKIADCAVTIAKAVPVLNEFKDEALAGTYLEPMIALLIRSSVGRHGEWIARSYASMMEEALLEWIQKKLPEIAPEIDEPRVNVDLRYKRGAAGQFARRASGLPTP